MLNSQTPFDSLWNYNKPAETEIVFRNMLQSSEIQSNIDWSGQLKTQIVRTLSLQAKFEEALQLLEVIQQQYDFNQYPIIGIRFYLEKGRTLQSSKIRKQAFSCFEQAYTAAQASQLEFYAVDALHMMAIAADSSDVLKWNIKAMEAAENAKDPRARNWLGSLYNNIGWYYYDLKNYKEALGLFEKALQWRIEKGELNSIRIAHWCIARTYRAMKEYDLALSIQQKLYLELKEKDDEDGYIDEELGELYLIKGMKQELAFHFNRAFISLSKDIWMQKNESDRLKRMESLSR